MIFLERIRKNTIIYTKLLKKIALYFNYLVSIFFPQHKTKDQQQDCID